MGIKGHATDEGTRRYAGRFEELVGRGHFRRNRGLTTSSIGIGTYLGGANDATDSLVSDAVDAVVKGGMNVIDSAANYRRERGEKSVGIALNRMFSNGTAKRDEVLICTKGGFIPHGGDWFETNHVGRGRVTTDDLVGGVHCMHPDYLEAQLNQSLANLGVDTIDVYYVHNPESQAGKVPAAVFKDRLEAAFRILEGAVRAGKIRAYGVATWNAFRVEGNVSGAMSLAATKNAAQRVSGDIADAMHYVQLPLNLAMTEALIKPVQDLGGQGMPAIRTATSLGLKVMASGAIRQAKLGDLPAHVRTAIGDHMTSDAQRALQFTRSAPGIATALIGLKQPSHVEEALNLCREAPMKPGDVLSMFGRR